MALCAFVCGLPLAGCGGGGGNSGDAKTAASSGGSAGEREAGATHSSPGARSAGEGAGAPNRDASGQGEQPPPQTPQHARKPDSPPKPHSGGGKTAGFSAQETATYDAARALCANRDSLQYAPAEIRDDAGALAEFAERFAPQGEGQVVHDGCLAGLKSIGID